MRNGFLRINQYYAVLDLDPWNLLERLEPFAEAMQKMR